MDASCCSRILAFALVLAVCCHFAASLSTRPSKLVVGINKYSHDASICILDSSDGSVLFAQAKERISGKKHDGGAVGELVNYGLEYLKASTDDVSIVVSNNHHFRVLPFERRVGIASSLKYVPSNYASSSNLLPKARHLELSHHLAHAWSVVGTAPFRQGLVLVMDGMGESYKAMAEDMSGAEEHSGDYMHDLRLLRAYGNQDFVGQPMALMPGSSYREAESAYVFDGTSLRPVFKRWQRERSPPELYNHGFENMESLGAVYSRVSSHVLGDWNACGKIMGLGPWSGKHRNDARTWGYNKDLAKLGLGDDFHHRVGTMSGNPYDGSFEVNWGSLEGQEGGGGKHMGPCNAWSDERFSLLANIASSVQGDVEGSALALASSLKDSSKQTNLALAGGVALNSVLNGRLTHELGFENVFVPPAPGDEGVAVGCAMYGLQRLREQDKFDREEEERKASVSSSSAPAAPTPPLAIVASSFSAYQGRAFSEEEIEEALDDFAQWIQVRFIDSEQDMADQAAAEIAKGSVIAWFQGRSEFGQRALGSRSILADPRLAEVRNLVNSKVKEREWWRPLAPSVLDEHAGDWFEKLVNNGNASPYMSLTAQVKESKAAQVPAICHIDGTARLQTVRQEDAPLYHSLIKAFFKLTGIPMVLNTSFNRNKQPIIETPNDALSTFLVCEGHVQALFIGKWVVTRRPFPLVGAKSAKETDAAILVSAPPYYISEVTSASPTADASRDGSPLRVRIQNGQGGEEGSWIELPSSIHLDILQILQPASDSSASSSSAAAAAGAYAPHDAGDSESDVPVVDLFEALQEVANASDDNGNSDGLSWKVYVEALQWLHSRQLVSFDDPSMQTLEGDVFKGAEILDLRSL